MFSRPSATQDEAIANYRECVQHNPDHGETWWSLANLKTFRFHHDDIDVMEKRDAEERLADEQRANFLSRWAKRMKTSR